MSDKSWGRSRQGLAIFVKFEFRQGEESEAEFRASGQTVDDL